MRKDNLNEIITASRVLCSEFFCLDLNIQIFGIEKLIKNKDVIPVSCYQHSVGMPIVGMGKDESATNCLVMAPRPPYHMSFMERFFYPLERDKIGNAKKIPISSVAPPYRCHTTVLCLLYDCFSFLFYGYPSIAKIK